MVDWEKFKAKYSQNPQYHFEWLCYLIFCRKYNQPYGISRYANQSAIETSPIQEDVDVCIGFQAKFYDTRLSSHKDELLSMLEKAKRDYPHLNKIYLFTNQEWAQSFHHGKAQDPIGKIEIEEKAQTLNIDLIWNTKSFFESEFVSLKCKDIVDYFFANQSFLDTVQLFKSHTEDILSSIKDELFFNSKEIDLPRQSLDLPNHSCVVIHGIGGVGKTVEIKKTHQQIKDIQPFYLFKATEFNLNRLVDFYPAVDVDAFLSAFQDSERKTIVIDSAEKILDLENDDPFKEFIMLSVKYDWQIIFTTRDSYLDDLIYMLKDRLHLNPCLIPIQRLTIEELFTLADSNNFQIPEDEKVKELLTVPFYLNHYLSHYDPSNQNFSYAEFKDNLWNSIIRKSKPEREAKFLEVVKRKVLEGSFFIDATTIDGVESLLQDEILSNEKGNYFITHDLYEEWALNKIIEQAYLRQDLSLNFFQSITSSLPVRRAFRQWVSEKLLLNDQEFLNNLYDCIEEIKLEQHWKDEILTSLLLSKDAGAFFNYFRHELSQNSELFRKICFILRIACKTTDTSLFKDIGIKQVDLINGAQYLFSQPKGEGWNVLIDFIYQYRNSLIERETNQILPLLQDWVLKNKEGETTRLAGLIALDLYKKSHANKQYLKDNNEKVLLRILSNSACEIKEELEILTDKILQNNVNSSKAPYFSFAEYLLTNIEAWNIAKVIPTRTLALAQLFWLKDYSNKRESFYSRIKDEEKFGVTNNSSFRYFPASAWQTPLFVLFNSRFRETLNFVIQFVNQLIKNYVQFSLNDKDNYFKRDSGDPLLDSNNIKEINLNIDGKEYKQYSSVDLWLAYRGMFVCPYLLQSILMALEKKLLNIAESSKNPEDICVLNRILQKIIKESNSVVLTAVVSSIVNAYSEKTYPTAKILFSSKEFFLLDINRFSKDKTYESGINMVRSLLGRPKSMGGIYEQERERSGKLEHRKQFHLETLFLNYQLFNQEDLASEQFSERRNELWKIVDEYKQVIAQESNDNTNWPYILARLDVRELKPEIQKKEDHIEIALHPELSPELEKQGSERIAEFQETYQHINLKLWADYKLRGDERFKQYFNYEKNPLSAYFEMEKCIEQGFDTEQKMIINRAIPEIVASALIKFHSDLLDKEQQIKCKNIIWQRLFSTLLDNYLFSDGDGVDICFYVLPNLLELFPELIHEAKILLILSLFDDYNISMGSDNYRNIPLNVCVKLQKNYPKEMESVVLGYLYFSPLYFEYQQIFHKPRKEISNALEAFWEKYNEFLVKIEYNKFDIQQGPNLEEISCSNKVTLFLLISQSNNPLFKKLCDELISFLLPELLSNDCSNKYYLRNDFIELFSLYILRLEDQQQIQEYLNLIIEIGSKNQYLSDIFDEFLLAQDKSQHSDNFWFIWKELESFILDVALGRKWISNSTEVILSYLFASFIWKKEAKNWHTFQLRDRRFFKSLSKQLPCNYSILYAYVKLLNGLGYELYFKEGLNWLNNLIKNELSQNNRDGEYKNIAIEQMENYIRNYIYQFATKIRKQKNIKESVITILNWLIEQGSVTGYLLREKIL